MSEEQQDSIKKLVSSMTGDFKVTTGGSASFEHRFDKSTRHGELANLHNNAKAIVDVVKNRQRDIRLNMYDRRKRKADLAAIVASGNVSKEDKREIGELLGALADRNSLLDSAKTSAQTDMRRDLPEILQKKHVIEDRSKRNLPYNPNEATGVSRLGGNRSVNSLSASSTQSLGKTSLPRLVK
jgi:hypothetical protein